jgi:hypothetical protein
MTAQEKAIEWLHENMTGFDVRYCQDDISALTALITGQATKFIELCDTLDNTCLGNGTDDMVSVGRSQYMALINYANEMRGE